MTRNFVPVLAAAILIQGCSSDGGAPTRKEDPFSQRFPAQVLYNGLICNASDRAQALWIADPATFKRYWSRIAANDAEAAQPPFVDFGTDGALLISMGQRPTSGYRLNYSPNQPALYNGSVLRIQLSWLEADPEALQAQAVTSPCLVLRLPQISYQRLQVVDHNGEVKLEAGRSASRASGS